MISIIIPVYNQAEHLMHCLVSIKKQTYDNYEIIVVNDGSTDNVIAVIEKFKQIFGFNLTYSEQENKGASAARNKGDKLAKGEYIIFCDADVVMKPTMLELMLNTLKHNQSASFCYSSFILGYKKFKLWSYDVEKLKIMPYIHTTSLIKKEHFPGFDETLKKFQDWDLWLTMLDHGHAGVWVNQVLFKVAVTGTQTMSNWLPSFIYKLLPWLPAVKKYNQAMSIIKKKHNNES
ncbi:glycosyltransferase family 2 protein [Patescibacteria group bacterium]|nr:glycosyltransferase family 2 protein [Patescibacteria group bacterium]MBU1663583.1 glycosyltransferase family 2 protein [Patescibacteria group bacterium]MBU1933886.1 glycosyltransferase family 2 protein [Patescibacteria group bacterium]MBU2007840.1 glycosyltransferase family 2 protein [Patescibacteria group bacterium]MBU2233807.1 glycosyltransferase family 2 protein [Patescibacteria group bacterium]